MDLVDRYVSSVRTYLPKAQQDDIVNELSENIRAQMDDREDELGRPLTEDEQEAILQQHGHPMLAAARYQPNQAGVAFGRQLISTALFPFYLRVLWITMGASFAIYLVVVAALIVSGTGVTFAGVMNAILLQIFFQFGTVTLIFAAGEHYLPTMKWSARSLPAPRTPSRQGPQVSRLESMGKIVGIFVFLIWLRVVLDNPALLFGPVADTYQLGPVWQQVALPTVLIFVVNIVQAVINLFRPDWIPLRSVVRLLTDVAGLGILAYLLRASQWVVLANANGPDDATLNTINQWVYYGMLCVAIGFVVVIVMDAWKLMRGERNRAA
jgi:hypothetical protein